MTAPEDHSDEWLAGSSRPEFGHPIPPTVHGKLPPEWEQRLIAEIDAEIEHRDNGGPE